MILYLVLANPIPDGIAYRVVLSQRYADFYTRIPEGFNIGSKAEPGKYTTPKVVEYMFSEIAVLILFD